MCRSLLFALAALVMLGCSPKINAQNNTGYRAPDWARHVVWYQIFPERFANGDTTNEPTAERIGAPDNWQLSPWTGDWYQRAHWEQRVGPKFTDFVLERRYGGDLQGVINRLPYLDSLGIGAIYFNPVFDAVSLHKYDASSYHHIDRFFGPDPEGDVRIMEAEDPADPSTWQWTSADSLFLELLDKAHQRGIRVVIDGVFNHTGQDFWAFRDLKKRQQDSPYSNWYDVKSFDDPATPDTNEFDFHGWWGFKGLPELKEVDGNLVKPVREHIFAITRRWMDPNGDGDPSDGIDGWRLDVAQDVGHPFWREWHALVRDINPEAYTTAEVWTPDAKNYINSEEFTAVMNYRFAMAVQDFMIDQRMTATTFSDTLAAIRADYPEGSNEVLQNLMASHDTPRLASMIVNPGREYDRDGKPSDGFKVRKPNKKERRVQRLITLFQMTYVGAPMIYYGDEAGMWGADDPSDRKPMVWPDLEYLDEVNHPYSEDRPRDSNNFDHELFQWYQQLIQMRNSSELLRTGFYQTVVAKDDAKLFTFVRHNRKGDYVLVALNRSDEPQKATIQLPQNLIRTSTLHPMPDGKRLDVRQREVTLELEPVSGGVWSARPR